MAEREIDFLKTCVRELAEPENLFQGMRLPENFELPDDILLFYHDYCAPAPNAHCRYTLVFPLARMHYLVDQEEYDIAEGDMLLIRPYARRFLSPRSGGYQRFFITFQLKTPQSYLPEGCLHRLPEPALAHLRKVTACYQANDVQGTSLALHAFLTTLSPGSVRGRERLLSPPIAKVLALINDDVGNAPGIKEMAARVNMSPGNLARKFRSELGMSIHRCVSARKLEFARYCLRRTRMDMEEIARNCGFQSGSGFSHFFTKQTGVSPLAYRKGRETSPPPGRVRERGSVSAAPGPEKCFSS